ncbi:MAG: PepSY1/2 domain-containing protein [Solibacillus sp.]
MKNAVYLLGLLVVILTVYSYDAKTKQAQLEKNVYALHMNSMSEASEKLAQLNRSVSQSLLYKDEEARNGELQDVWRMSSDLRSDIAKLPIQDEVRVSWMKYLGKIGDTAKKSVGTDHEQWAKQMTNVSSNLRSLTEEWNVATTNFYEHQGNFSGWKEQGQLAIADSSFNSLSKQLTSYQETDFPLTASESDFEKKRDLAHLMGKQITKSEAIARFKILFPRIDEATLTVTKSKDDAPYPFYHIQFIHGSRIGYADITENGGEVISFLLERPIRKEVRSHEEIVKAGEQFMEKAGYKDVVLAEARENHEAWHFVFTRKANDALVYPDSIQLKVAKDNGEVLGMNAMEYVQKETLPVQQVSEPDWAQFFAEDVAVEEIKEIYTTNDALELRHCFEVLVRKKDARGETYRAVIDAETHEVVKIEQLQ